MILLKECARNELDEKAREGGIRHTESILVIFKWKMAFKDASLTRSASLFLNA